MTPERLKKIKSLYYAALALHPKDRPSFLAGACGKDIQLLAKVAAMLAGPDEKGDLVEKTILDAVGEAPDIDGMVENLEKKESDLPFERLGTYRLLSHLGEDDTGVVYLAIDETIGRQVALKVLRTEETGTFAMEKHYWSEGQAISSLNHPNILTVYEMGEEKGLHYIAMEVVPGNNLATELERSVARGERILPWRALGWIIGVARALETAHQAGIIHRDIKPSNIRINPEGSAKLTDFGAARNRTVSTRTLTRKFRGTPFYASPEQVKEEDGGEIDKRTDIYSLGVTLYEVLTGRLPFQGETTEKVFLEIMEGKPPSPRQLNPAISRKLEKVIKTAMQREPRNRYQSMAEFADDLQRILSGEKVQAKTASYKSVAFNKVKQNPIRNTAVSTALLALLALVLYWAVSGGEGVQKNATVNEGEGGSGLLTAGGNANAPATRDSEGESGFSLEDYEISEEEAKTEAARLASLSSNLMDSNPGLALLLAIEAEDRSSGLEVNNTLFKALESCHETGTFFHRKRVNFVSFSPDGGRMISASSDGSARIWDVKKRQRVLTLTGHEGAVYSGAFSPNGERAVTASQDGTARIWDALIGKELFVLEGHDQPVVTSSFSPNGRRILTASLDGIAKIWDGKSGKMLLELKGHTDGINSAVFNPDGTRVVTASKDGTARV